MKKSDTKIKTVIVDDHAVFRAGLMKLLESIPEVEVVEQLDAGEPLANILNSKPIDLVILDISLPKANGLAILKELKKEKIKAKILVLSMHKVAEYCRLSLKYGASGYVLKEDAFEQVEHAIKAIVHEQKQYISPSITALVADQFFQTETPLLPEVLTKTEKIILEKIASGMSNKEIGLAMKISVRTVETHRAHILKKLKIKNTAGLVRYAIKHNLVGVNNHL
jgi:DNA-binding NarL/FixJ family response regulator